jgi:GntR family transcriptional regulator
MPGSSAPPRSRSKRERRDVTVDDVQSSVAVAGSRRTSEIGDRDRRPLGVQVYSAIREQIHAGDFPAGDRLPSETTLAESYGVSRVTIREALRLLQRDLLIQSVHGRGHFVLDTSKLVETQVTELQSVTELMRGRGYAVETTTLSLVEEPAGAHAEQLRIGEDEPVLRLERVRSTDGVPMIYSIDVFPAQNVAGSEDAIREGASLIDAFSDHGVVIAYCNATISAAELPAAAAHAAGFPKVPFVLMEQVNFDTEHAPALYSLDYHRGDRFKFSVVRTRDSR